MSCNTNIQNYSFHKLWNKMQSTKRLFKNRSTYRVINYFKSFLNLWIFRVYSSQKYNLLCTSSVKIVEKILEVWRKMLGMTFYWWIWTIFSVLLPMLLLKVWRIGKTFQEISQVKKAKILQKIQKKKIVCITIYQGCFNF